MAREGGNAACRFWQQLRLSRVALITSVTPHSTHSDACTGILAGRQQGKEYLQRWMGHIMKRLTLQHFLFVCGTQCRERDDLSSWHLFKNCVWGQVTRMQAEFGQEQVGLCADCPPRWRGHGWAATSTAHIIYFPLQTMQTGASLQLEAHCRLECMQARTAYAAGGVLNSLREPCVSTCHVLSPCPWHAYLHAGFLLSSCALQMLAGILPTR